MSDTRYELEVASQPVGFLVYIKENKVKLSLAAFCHSSGMDVLGVMKVLTMSSGFKPEPEDAIGFFLFEDNAKKFIDAISGALVAG